MDDGLVAAKVEPAKYIAPEDLPKVPRKTRPTLSDRIRDWLRDQYSVFTASRAKIDVNAKCPRCGHRQGRIEFDEGREQIIHHCLVCRARWGSDPLLDIH